jgi:hypothetical protein
MNKIFLFFFLLLLTDQAAASDILLVDLVVHKNDSVELRELRITSGRPLIDIESGPYRIEVTDSNGTVVLDRDLMISFLIMSDPPVETDQSFVSLRIPYNSRMKHVNIYKADKQIFSQDLRLCNNNGICDTDYESSLSCPKDCPPYREDKTCINDSDGICDPDCLSGLDPDCSSGNLGFLPYVLFVVLLILAIVFAYKRIDKRKI